jgi:hypothetical protein
VTGSTVDDIGLAWIYFGNGGNNLRARQMWVDASSTAALGLSIRDCDGCT